MCSAASYNHIGLSFSCWWKAFKSQMSNQTGCETVGWTPRITGFYLQTTFTLRPQFLRSWHVNSRAMKWVSVISCFSPSHHHHRQYGGDEGSGGVAGISGWGHLRVARGSFLLVGMSCRELYKAPLWPNEWSDCCFFEKTANILIIATMTTVVWSENDGRCQTLTLSLCMCLCRALRPGVIKLGLDTGRRPTVEECLRIVSVVCVWQLLSDTHRKGKWIYGPLLWLYVIPCSVKMDLLYLSPIIHQRKDF